MSDLETKIAARVQELNDAKAEAEAKKQAEKSEQQQKFEVDCKRAADLAISIGVTKDAITTPAFGESSVPYATFMVAGVPCALELRDPEGVQGLFTLKVSNTHQGDFHPDDESLKEQVERSLVEAIAQHMNTEAQLPSAN